MDIPPRRGGGPPAHNASNFCTKKGSPCSGDPTNFGSNPGAPGGGSLPSGGGYNSRVAQNRMKKRREKNVKRHIQRIIRNITPSEVEKWDLRLPSEENSKVGQPLNSHEQFFIGKKLESATPPTARICGMIDVTEK